MKRPLVHITVLFVLLALPYGARNARGASGDPPIVLPRMTMMTHGAADICQVLFPRDGKGLFVVPYEDTCAIARAPKKLNDRTASISSAVVQAARDQVADGSMILAVHPTADARMIDGRVVRGGEMTAPVMLCDVESGKQVARWGAGLVYYGCTLTPDGMTFIGFSDRSDTLGLWDTASGTLCRTIDMGNFCNVEFHVTPDSMQLVAGVDIKSDRKRMVRRYDLFSGEPIDELDLDANDCFGTAISTDGKYLATGNLIWDTKTGSLVCGLHNRDGSAWSAIINLKFTPNSKYLLGQADRGMIAVADLISGTVIERAFPEYDDAYALSPDGNVVAAYKSTGEYRNLIRLYDISTRRMIARLAPVPASANSLCFSPDGRTLAAVCYGGATRIWDISQFTRVDNFK